MAGLLTSVWGKSPRESHLEKTKSTKRWEKSVKEKKRRSFELARNVTRRAYLHEVVV